MKILIEKIIPNPQQPRKYINQNELKKLAKSIQEVGLIHPIAVEEHGDQYILIAGERRMRAHQLLGETEIEANIFPSLNGHGDLDRLVKAMVENTARSDLGPIDKALGFKKMWDAGLSHRQIGESCGLSQSMIGFYISMLNFPEEIQELLREKRLTAETGGVKALLHIEDKELQITLARMAAKRGLSGPSIQRLVNRMSYQSRRKQEVIRWQEMQSANPIPERNRTGHWNMIMQAGIGLDHQDLDEAATETCLECPLYDDASDKMCRDCPGAILLKKFMVRKNGDG